MASGFGKVAEALAHVASGIGGGYGEGLLKTALLKREEYQQQLKQQWAKEESAEDRAFRTGEAEKGREHDFSLLEKRQEFDLASEERQLQNSLTLEKMRQSGRKGKSGGKESAYLKRARELEEYRAKAEGREPSEAGVLAELEKLNTGRSGSTESTYLKRAREREELAARAEGRPVNEQNVLKNFDEFSRGKKSDTADTVTSKDIARDISSKMKDLSDGFSREAREFQKKSPEEQRDIAARAVYEDYTYAGTKVPEAFSTRFQESKAEATQPQAVEAPPTSTQGDKPTLETAPGSGTEADPYVANTPEQQRWVRDHAPPGAYVVVGGRVKRKPNPQKAP